jgi:thiol:disulfide interchange protein
MNRTVTGIFGFILLITAIALPFLGLQQSSGDVLPLLIAFLVLLASGAFFVLAIRPVYLKGYLIAVAALLVVLTVLGGAGFFHHSSPQRMTQQ